MLIDIIIGLIVKLELLFFITLGISWLLNRGFCLKQSIPVAIVFCVALYSFFIQLGFLLGQPQLLLFFELVLIGLALTYIARNPDRYRNCLGLLTATLRQKNIYIGLLYVVLIYLFWLAFLIPEGNYDSMRYNIARIPLFMQARTFFLDSFTEFHQVVFPVGADILFYPSLRFGSDFGLANSAWLAYVAIISSAYAVARHFSSRSVANTTMLIIASVPILVYQSTGTKPDIWSAAAASVAVLLFIRLYEKSDGFELLLLLVVIAFGLSAKFNFGGFVIPFSLFVLMLIVKRPKDHLITYCFKTNLHFSLFILIVVLVLSQTWLMFYNHIQWGGLFGPEAFVDQHNHAHGISGMIANLVRYWFQSVHLLTPTDLIAEKLFGVRMTDWLHDFFYRYFYPIIDNQGINDHRPRFSLKTRFRWGDGENGAWFGPLGLLIILPAIIYGLFSRQKLIKAIAICLIVYVLILCWQVSWMPWNGRFFSLVPAASAAVVAVFLTRFFNKEFILSMVRILALIILLYGAIFNQEKELLNARMIMNLISGQAETSQVLSESIWSRTRFGSNRQYYTEKYFGDSRVIEFSKLVPGGASVGIVTAGSSWIYPFLAIRPDVTFIPLTWHRDLGYLGVNQTITGLPYVLCINTNCESLRHLATQLWPGESQQGRYGVLLQIP